MEPRPNGPIVTLALAVALSFAMANPSHAQEAPRSTRIALNSIDLDVTALPNLPATLRAETQAPEGVVALVKFAAPISTEGMAHLERSVAKIFTYLPEDAFLVRLPPGANLTSSAKLAKDLGALWVGPYHPAYKISRDAAAISSAADPNNSDDGEKSSKLHSLFVQVFPDADLFGLKSALVEMGITPAAGSRQSPFFSRLRLLLNADDIVRFREEIARRPEVFWVDLEPARRLLNDTTIWVGQSGLAGGMTTPLFSQGIRGEGQTIAVLDTGLDADMCYFRDTTRGLPPTNACNGGTVTDPLQRKVIAVNFLWANECAGGLAANEWDTQDHGTHVAGTAAGDNFATPILHDTADGMAPAAKLVIQDGGFLTDNCGDLPGIGCPVVDLNPIFQQTYDQGARIHTNSWGDNENAAMQNNYSAGSQDVDEFLWNHKDFVILFAAGNSGPGAATVGSPSTAKSGISVGSTLRGASANSMSGFSSCGQTTDSRIKPDLTVPGSSIVSANADNNTASNNCNTLTLSGTSMATPGGAGFAALTRQYFTEGWYPSGTKNAPDGFTPSGALVKATMVNSAINMTNATAIPSACQGWGRVLLENALFFATQTRKLWVRDDSAGLAAGAADQVFTFTVAAGEPLKVSLAWTDFPSTPAAAIHLINDLDVSVVGPSGTFLGNVFSGGNSTTGGTADRRNTLEQVLIAAPTAGTYTVRVKAFNIPNGPQPYALVVTGAVTAGAPPAVTVYTDDFETATGWTVNPNGTDTATLGLWERGDPEATNSGGAKQLGTTVSGLNDLVTARLAGASAGANDLDGGVTTIQSPAIVLPASGPLTLSFSYYFAHGTNSSSVDSLRVRVVGTTTTLVFEELGNTSNDNAVWATANVSLAAFAGQTVRIRIEAADLGGASLVEAAIDDVKITQP